MNDPEESHLTGWRARGHEIIFEADTPAGKAFDVALILVILTSILVVMLESVQHIALEYGPLLRAAEWAFTLLFTAEYLLRLACVRRPGGYARSFFGVVDLFSIAPTYISLMIPGVQALLVIRTLRILRVFRVLKLVHYVSESEVLMKALMASRRKIMVFLFAVLSLVVIFGSLMYLVEGPEHGFTSIPRGIYWAIVTMTTVGYGDISPQTGLGQGIAAFIMILGYGIIAVPTGIVTAQLTSSDSSRPRVSGKACRGCGADGHRFDAVFCRVCAARL